MSKIYESDIEQMTIEQLQAIGYRHVYGVDIEPSGIKPLRAYSQVLLQDNVLQAIATITHKLPQNNALKPISVSANITNSPHPIMSAII